MPSVMIVAENGELQMLLERLLASAPYQTLAISPDISLLHLQTTASKPDVAVITSNSQSETELTHIIR